MNLKRYDHMYAVAFTVLTNNDADHVTADEITMGISRRLSTLRGLPDSEILEAVGQPEETIDNGPHLAPEFPTTAHFPPFWIDETITDFTQFDSVEVSAVRYVDESRKDVEACPADQGDLWSVYLHLKIGGVTCVADAPTQGAAEIIAKGFTALLAKG